MNRAAISGRLEYLITNSPGLLSASTVSVFAIRTNHSYDNTVRVLTLRQEIELVNHKTLVLCPREIERLCRHKVRNAILRILFIVREYRKRVCAACLGEWEEGGGFLVAMSVEIERTERLTESQLTRMAEDAARSELCGRRSL